MTNTHNLRGGNSVIEAVINSNYESNTSSEANRIFSDKNLSESVSSNEKFCFNINLPRDIPDDR